MIDALKNLFIDLLDDRSPQRYATYPDLDAARSSLPLEVLADAGFMPSSYTDVMPRELTPAAAADGTLRGWSAN